MENATLSLAKAQQIIGEIAGQLQRIDDQLVELSSSLPEPTAQFDARAELHGAVECVRSELLADAIATLVKFTAANSFGLHLEFEIRQQLANQEAE